MDHIKHNRILTLPLKNSNLNPVIESGNEATTRQPRPYQHFIYPAIRMLFLLLVILAWNAGNYTAEAQETIGVYVSPPEVMEFNLAAPPYVPTTENFNGLSGTSWADPSHTSLIGTYSQTSGTSSVGPDDQYGAGTSDYLSIQESAAVTVELNDQTRYFGFAWPAGNDGNTVEVFRNGVSLFSINTSTIVDFLPNDATVRTSLDGSTHTSSDYYGKPVTGGNTNEPYAYVHIIASEGLLFDEIRLSHATGSGGAFETDNHTVLFEGQQPDVDGTDLDFIEVFSQVGPAANDDQSLNNTPGDPVTLDILSNDTPGDFPVDPTSVAITGSIPPGSTLAPDGKTLTVPGEGIWTVNATTGEITFTPEGGFLGDPTPIQYRISDTDGIASNIADVIVTYTTTIEAVDESAGPVDGITGTDNVLNVLDNDLLNGDILDPVDVTLTEVTSDPELTLNPDGSVDVEPGTPDGTYTVDYEICEDASPTNCDTATATVTVQSTVSIQITEGPCWRMLSSPAAGYSYSELLDGLWTQGVNGADYTDGTSNVYVWDNTHTGNTTDGWILPGSLNNDITPGTGFLISVFTDDEYGAGDTWSNKTLTVSNTENEAPVIVGSGVMNQNDNGWTLLGNPYKVPIDFSALTTADIVNVAYVYDRNYLGSGGWVSTTSDGFGDITGGIISPLQGFFVQNAASVSSPSVTFPASSRTTGGEFYGKEKSERKDFVRFEVSGQSLGSSMWIRFSDDGSIDKAMGDALKLMPLAEEYALVASRKQDGTLVDIGHYPYPNEELTIPVYFEGTEGGSYTITATDFDLPAGAELYFIDEQTNQSIRIDEHFKYQFTLGQTQKASPGSGGIIPCTSTPKKAKVSDQDRFLITSSKWNAGGGTEIPSQTTLEQNYPNPFNPTTQITYQLPEQSQVTLAVYDMGGRLVSTLVNESVNAGTHTVNFDASSLSSGVYMYRLNTGANVLTRKLTLIK